MLCSRVHSIRRRSRLRSTARPEIQPLQVLRIEKLLGWDHALPCQVESVRLLLISADGCTQGDEILRYRLELGEVDIFPILRHGRSIAISLVVSEGIWHWPLAGESLTDCGRE